MNFEPNLNDRETLERQLKWDLLRQKDAWNTGQKYNNPELQERAHDRAEIARAIAKAAGIDIPEGYGADNTLDVARALFNQEYGRQPQYDFQNPNPRMIQQNQQPQPQNAEEGKSIANANFARGAIAYHSQLPDNQSRNFGMQLLDLKRKWDALEGLKHQHDAILKNPTASDEDKQYAQQQIDAATQSQMQIHQRAEQLRTQGERLGIPLDMVGSGTTLNDAETNIEFEIQKAIRDMFVDKYSRNSADYYNQRYNEYRNQGLSKRHARERADADATQYQYDRMNAANDLFATVGTNGGQLTNYGMRLAKILAEEGDPSAAELFMNGYATPYQAWGRNQDRIDKAAEHGYSEDTAENNLRRSIALLAAGLNTDLTKMDKNQQYKLAQMILAGDIDLRNGIAKIGEQGKINSAEAARKRAFEEQKLNQRYQQELDKIYQTYKAKFSLEEFKNALNSQKVKTAFQVYRALGKSEEEAWLLANGYKTDAAANENLTEDKKLAYRCDNYIQQIKELMDKGNEDGARAVIEAAREFMDSDAGLESDSEAMKELRIMLREYEQRMSKDASPRDIDPYTQSEIEQKEEAINENRFENLTDPENFKPGTSYTGYSTKPSWVK